MVSHSREGLNSAYKKVIVLLPSGMWLVTSTRLCCLGHYIAPILPPGQFYTQMKVPADQATPPHYFPRELEHRHKENHCSCYLTQFSKPPGIIGCILEVTKPEFGSKRHFSRVNQSWVFEMSLALESALIIITPMLPKFCFHSEENWSILYEP